MSDANEVIKSLRAALAVSPDNLPLRRHLAETLLGARAYAEAESELRQVLEQTPHDLAMRLALADCFYRQDKMSSALVVTEELVRLDNAPAAAFVLHARLLLRDGETRDAVSAYRRALEIDPQAMDLSLTAKLGVRPPGHDNSSSDVVDGKVRAAFGDAGNDTEVEIERPKIGFAQVGGMKDLKEEIGMKIIYPLQHPEIYEAYGKKIGGGILMYGPPGCGKTHLARATAGEVNAGFISVGISDVLDMWIGQSERNLHELFDQARTNKPCVLFFDEVDALGAKRSDMRQGGNRHLINQFLAEMDGIESANDGVLILAATNAPWHLDAAFRRPGRFDRIIFVPPPDEEARKQILDILLAGKPTDKVDCTQLAEKAANFSGADLRAAVDKAIELKLTEAMKKGVPTPLTTRDLLKAVKAIKPTTREWFSTARNYALYANQDGVYDDVLNYVKR